MAVAEHLLRRTAAEPRKGMERSFAAEVDKLRLGAGEVFHGEAILAVTKALLQAGVAYVGGYPGAPVSHLMDVLADAREAVLEPMGVHFEASASEAAAAALLGASIHYPLRGAVTWKSIVGTNVASDALSNLASAGVTGGALIIVGEDYGEGASVIQERTHAFALKSSMPLLDPRYHMPRLVELTEQAFELSEACHLPVILSLRIRAAHMTGSFVCKDNRPPPYNRLHPFPEARFDYGRIVLPPSTYAQEKAKFEARLPAARRFILEHGINEHHPGDGGRIGVILQGGLWGVTLRGLRRLGAADAYGRTPLPLLVLNAVHPLVPEQIAEFLRGKDHVLVVEEGNPPFIEEQVRALAQREGIAVRVWGKDVLPMAGEYTADVVRRGLARWLAEAAPAGAGREAGTREAAIEAAVAQARKALDGPMPPRPPGFCTGCPERPLFTALKLLMRERGPIHVSSDIGCNTFATLPPFNLGSTVLGYGLSLASGGAVGPALGQPTVAVMGDGGFWHNGLVSGAANAHWNRLDAVLVILENGYASATGQQHVPSTGATPWGEPVRLSIEQTLRGMGVRWIRRVDAYDVPATLEVLREALDARGQGLRVVISDQECRLARERRERRTRAQAIAEGRTVTLARFGVDTEVCTGDHSCMRLSGCPALTLRPAADPLKDGPTAMVGADCVGCGLCGSAAHAAALCPSFYQARRIVHPRPWRRWRARAAERILAWMGAS
ncbi:indolepyruvate ferredoxin oxidoreductase subunit alpha [Inmirania thermothiophila]|uniref:Indolepyruvate ferredoxin oxidoreductase alpha subunit n=1 Tax=Inmirania thermothiophila TaxID=1750597 RepID=A0A3N1Y0Y7_9GAMM|nr:indolepyruvate ferredoxin oxidoreductase subunit alpha [Inmirania thermothiophila]ROR32499.1 indolepyruvate ferredoxin oxidoreductase alpha subunit [Inmirania thermothiophila]